MKVAIGCDHAGVDLKTQIAANKLHGFGAVVCSEPYSARMAREHNDANILAFGARVVGPELAKTITDAFLDARYQAGILVARLALVSAIERGEAI
jgi:ribose 5-phosphate isomerase B